MKKQLVFGLALAAVAASWGCNDDIKVEHRTFEQLCVNSGGTIDTDNNRVCKCGKGNNASSCAPGVVCINNGEYCADSSIVCSHNNVGFISCKEGGTPETLNVMSIQICQPIDGNSSSVDDSNYKYRPFTLTTEQMNEYKSEDLNGTCKCVDEGCTKTVSCSGNVCGECVNGDKKCDLIDNVNGIYYCDDGKWRQDKACVNNVSCNKDNDCGNCINGEQRCVVGSDGKNAEIQKCNDGEWEKVSDCSTVSCDTTAKQCGICHGTTTSCVDDANTGIGAYYECRENNWLNTTCGGGVSCKSDTECGECHDGDKRCVAGEGDNNAVTQTCAGGIWNDDDEQNCKTSSCDPSGTSCASCIDGDTRCENGIITKCMNGLWGNDTICPNNASCQSKTECGDCHDGDTKCEENQYSICQGGMWGDAIDCPEDAPCNSEQTSCGECNNSTIKCEDGVRMRCVNYKWSAPEICDYGCNEAGDNCNECEGSGKQCKDDISFVCEKGKKIAVTKCDFGCVEDGVDCKECDVKFDTACVNEQIFNCVEGKLEPKLTNGILEKCQYGCLNATSCAECNPGDSECVDDKGTNKSRTCINGKWSEYKNCSADVSCTYDGKCGECKDGVTDCMVNLFKKCEKGLWSESVKCTYEYCATETKCAECRNESQRCTGESTYEECIDGIWKAKECTQDKKYCINVQNDDDMKIRCDNSCDAKDNYCVDALDGGSEFICNNRVFTPNLCLNSGNNVSCTNCANGVCKTCGTCLNGSDVFSQQESEQICIHQKCSEGKLGTINDNLNKYSCKYDGGKPSGIGDCHNSMEPTYKNNANQICIRTTCQQGELKTEQQPENYSCNKDNTGYGSCNNNLKPTYSQGADQICIEHKCESGTLVNIPNPNSYSCNADKTNVGKCHNGWFSKKGITVDDKTGKCTLSGGGERCKDGDWEDYNSVLHSCSCGKNGDQYNLSDCKEPI